MVNSKLIMKLTKSKIPFLKYITREI